MNISLTNFPSLISIVLASHGLMLALLILVSKKWNRLIFTYSGLLLVLSLILVEYFFSFSGLDNAMPHIIAIKIPLLMLIGPLYFLWSEYKTGRQASLWDTVHIIPFFVICALLAPFFVLPAAEKIAVASTSGDSQIRTIYLLATFLHLLFYVFLTKHKMKTQSSKPQEKTLHKPLHTGFSILLFAFGLTIILFMLGKVSIGFNRFFFVIGLGLMIHFLTYILLKKPNSFVVKQITNDPELKLLATRVQDYLMTEKPYLNKGFSKSDLSEALGSNQNYISKAFNDVLKTSFTSHVNDLRVEEAKELLINTDDKMFAIALNTGFTSNNSFTRVFKQHTNRTPAEFRNLNRNNDSQFTN